MDTSGGSSKDTLLAGESDEDDTGDKSTQYDGHLQCSDGEEDLFSGADVARAPAEISNVQRNVIYFCLGLDTLLISAAVSIMMPVMAIEGDAKNHDRDVTKRASVGLVFSVAKFTEFFAAPLLASELQNVGSKFLVVLSTMAVAGILLIFGLIDYIDEWKYFLALAYAIRVVQGVFSVGNYVAVYAIFVTILPNSLSFANGSLRAFNGFGYAVGPFLGGALFDAGGFLLPFAVGCGMLVLIGLLLLFALPSVDLVKANVGEETETPDVGSAHALTVPWAWVALLLLFSGAFLMGAFEPTLPLYFHYRFGTNTTVSGLAFFLYGCVYATFAPSIGYIVDCGYLKMRPIQAAGLLLSALACQLTGPAPYLHWEASLPLSFLAMVPYAIGTACVITMSAPDITATLVEHGVATQTQVRYTVAGLTRAAMALGYGSGPFVSSIVTSTLGFPTGMSAIGAFYMAFFVFIFIHALMDCLKPETSKAGPPKSPEDEELIKAIK